MSNLDYDKNYKKDFQCWNCGKTMTFTRVRPKKRVFCDECLEKHIREHDEKIEEYSKLKVEIMHENALRKMEKADFVFVSDYREAIEEVRKMEILKPESFMSAAEIIMAIILFEEGYEFKINHKILKYKVDFYIPEEHICLELDSSLHDIGNCRAKDGKRDIDLRDHLGAQWETVRIPTTYVEKYPEKVIAAMIELANRQRKLRNENNGHIPSWYSKSARAYSYSICPDRLQKIYKK